MVWKQLSCGHIFCHNCLEQKREARRKKLQAESDEKWGKLQVCPILTQMTHLRPDHVIAHH